MLFTNILMEKTMKKYDMSCNYINLFFLSALDVKTDTKLYYHIFHCNDFMDNTDVLQIAKIYIKTKKIKNKLEKIVRLYKQKKAISYDCNTDLYLNCLDDFKDKYKITIIENKTKYKFRLSNLINYWVESLTNNEALFSKPIPLTNPHTNLDISKYNLYNIYFKLLNTGFNIPLCINAFFQCDMDITIFAFKYYTMLKEKTIEHFIKQTNNIYDKWDQVINMLHDYRKFINYLTFSNFVSYQTKISICKKLKIPLNHYLRYKFSCNPLIKKNENIEAKKKIKKYLIENPNFGLKRGSEVIRYVPLAERPRPRPIIPPPPPIINSVIPENPPPPPPPQPPAPPQPPPQPITITLPTIHEINFVDNYDTPFQPSRQLPRTPTNSNTINTRTSTMRSSLSLFRR